MTLRELMKELYPQLTEDQLDKAHAIFSMFVGPVTQRNVGGDIVRKMRKAKALLDEQGLGGLV